eukprot:6011576-Ditylum_brightwellii.AAC.1
MIENDLTLMYAQFPYGSNQNNVKLGNKLSQVYNMRLCGISPHNKYRYLHAKVYKDQPTIFEMLGCMYHISNLDDYHKDIHQQFLKVFMGDYRFSRKSDAQMDVTLVAVMEKYLQKNKSTHTPKKMST